MVAGLVDWVRELRWLERAVSPSSIEGQGLDERVARPRHTGEFGRLSVFLYRL
jgi:hypothetical protein